jgi:hypothetical protein
MEECGEGLYLLTFATQLKNYQEFRAILKNDIEMCLDEGDKICRASWEEQSMTLQIADYPAFQRRLIYVNILIEDLGAP